MCFYKKYEIYIGVGPSHTLRYAFHREYMYCWQD